MLSNPIVFEGVFNRSLTRALIVTSVAVLVTLPWAVIPRVSPPVVALLAWGLLSHEWSILPNDTLNYWVQATVIAFMAVTVASQVQPMVMVEGLVLGGVLVAGLSWYAHLTDMPLASFLTLDGEVGIAGVGTNRNILAYTVVISFAALVSHVPRAWPTRVAWAVAGGLLLFTLFESSSTTGYAAGCTTVVMSACLTGYVRAGAWLHASRGRFWSALVGLLGVLSIGIYALARLGGEEIQTFSGRLPFWEAAWTVAQDEFVHGFGWGAVWAHPWAPATPNIVVERIYIEAGGSLSHGHNSLVDVIVELGLIGVGLVLLIHAWIIYRGARSAARVVEGGGRADYPRLVLVVVAALIVTGVTEPMSVIPVGWWSLVLLLHLAPVEEVTRDTRVTTDPQAEGAAD